MVMNSGRFRLRALAARLRGFLSGHRRDAEFDEEIREHVQALTERYVAQGMSREAAAERARRQFGNTTLLQENRRAMQTLPSVEAWWRDLRYATRLLCKDRGFSVVSIVTLGLGIGATTAIFSLVYNMLLAPFPYQGAERMVFPRIQDAKQGDGAGRQGFRAREILEIAEHHHVFDGLTAAFWQPMAYHRGEGAERLGAALVTPGTFEFFGMPALHGRTLQPSDYEPGAPPVFVLRHKTWMERFNGDPSILGRTLVLGDTPRTIVGIMPPRFGWYGADAFIPHKLTRDGQSPVSSQPYWFLVGRLKPAVSIQQAEAELTVIARRIAKDFPQQYPQQFTVQARRLLDSAVGRFEATLLTVLAAVGVLLLIACSNVANLMLARATMREKEFALRAVLGAGRAGLVRLMMVESLVLALAAALLGIGLAWGGLKALVAVMPQDVIPSESVIELNPPVLAFTLAVAVLTALVFGLMPALQSSRRDLNNPLRDSGKGTSGGFKGRRFRDAVVVVEVGLSLTLLIGAGLLMRSFVALRQADLGVDADHVLQTSFVVPAGRYTDADRATRFFQPVLARVKALPGVVDAAFSSSLPPYSGGQSRVEIAGETSGDEWRTLFQHVSEDYFRALRVELRRGRSFSQAEVDAARTVAVVNEAFVRRYLPNEDPIGRLVRLPGSEAPASSGRNDSFEIVGVAADVVNNRGLQTPNEPEMWLPYTIIGSAPDVLIVRTSQDPATMVNAVRREVWATDSGVALVNPGALVDFIGERLYAGPRFGFLVMTLFGCIGLVLVTVGVYGVLAYSTTQKKHEIGIRMALGAEAADARRLVVNAGLRLVAAGIAIGIPVSLVLGRVIETQLVGVTTYDPPTLVTTTLLLLMTAALACWIPARRAARVDPMVALRDQ
jgi:putative ABC transport system permease protein